MRMQLPSDNSFPQTNTKRQLLISASDLAHNVRDRLLASPPLDDSAIRVDQFAHDLLAFGLHYFPRYTARPPAQVHKDLCAELERILASTDTERFACAAPRGIAKSTWVSLIFTLFCAVHTRKRFVVLFLKNFSLASTLISDLKHELEHNDRLAADFPWACGRGPVWKRDEIITNSGVKILGVASGSPIRGRKHREHRPDLLILDDIEDDQHVRSLDQRNKLSHWLNNAVLKAKGVDAKADFVAIGTLLHHDSLLARLLDPTRSPGWRGRKFKSVIRWSTRRDLWDQWTAFYTDWHRSDVERLSQAERYFQLHRDEMLAGTEVIWAEVESYYDLMKLRADEGATSFDCEKQNEPVDPDLCEFDEASFRFFDEISVNGEVYLQPDSGSR